SLGVLDGDAGQVEPQDRTAGAWRGFARSVHRTGAGGERPNVGGHCLSSPRRWASAAASPRPATPSLARMWETCRLAVFSVMNSDWPICRLVRPAATKASTSVSRWVRPSDA